MKAKITIHYTDEFIRVVEKDVRVTRNGFIVDVLDAPEGIIKMTIEPFKSPFEHLDISEEAIKARLQMEL
jgi:hypothetical protein